MSASLVGSEMCIRDSFLMCSKSTWSPASAWTMSFLCWATYWGAMAWKEAVSYTHLTLPTICSV
eukprot:13298428-Alexandrium_andersonii.AAC.1